MIRKLFFVALAFATGCGGGGAKVGEGAPFSSLNPQPTAEQMYLSFTNAVAGATDEFLLFYRPFIPSGVVPSTRAQTSSNTEVFPCVLGGKITQKTSYSANGNALQITALTEFEDCLVSMTLNGADFEETLSGTSTFSGTGQMNSDSGTLRLTRGISASGDLGFALNCNLTASGQFGDQESASYSGTCTFLDSEGTELALSVADF